MRNTLLQCLAAGLFIIGLQVSPVPAHAESFGGVGDDGVLRLNVSPKGYPPYVIVDGDKVTGIVWEVVNRISSELNLSVEPARIPRKRVDEMILDGYIDATTRAIEWTDNPDQFLFTDPIVPVEEVFFYLASDDFEFRRPEDLESKVFVTHLGYQYPYLNDLFEEGLIQRFDVSIDLDLFRYLQDGNRFDAAIADRLVGQWLIRNNPQLGGEFESTEQSISNFGLRLMVRKDLAEFVSQFNAELAKLKDSGEMDQILSQYR